MWQHLTEATIDDHRNHNNRWDVAAELNRRMEQRWFWGAPTRRANEHLTSTKPSIEGQPLELRAVERRLREHHGLRPFPCRQLLGVGSVGSQALTGIPVLEHLRTHPALGERVTVWPFETIDVDVPHHIVLAEVWPSFLPSADIDAVTHPVKDARQVTALARHLAQLDRDGALANDLNPSFDAGIAAQVGREEGWVLLV
jgi:precorrin-8X/cobalt-precorrin-8 methylmutase